MAELADAPDLGSGTERCVGSNPSSRTSLLQNDLRRHFQLAREIETPDDFNLGEGFDSQAPGRLRLRTFAT